MKSRMDMINGSLGDKIIKYAIPGSLTVEYQKKYLQVL